MEEQDVAGHEPGERVFFFTQTGTIHELLTGPGPQQETKESLNQSGGPQGHEHLMSAQSAIPKWTHPQGCCQNPETSLAFSEGVEEAPQLSRREWMIQSSPGELHMEAHQNSLNLDGSVKVKEETAAGDAASLESQPECFRLFAYQIVEDCQKASPKYKYAAASLWVHSDEMTDADSIKCHSKTNLQATDDRNAPRLLGQGLLKEAAVDISKTEQLDTVKLLIHKDSLQQGDKKSDFPADSVLMNENEANHLLERPEQVVFNGESLEEHADTPVNQLVTYPGEISRKALHYVEESDCSRSFCESFDSLNCQKVDQGDKLHICSFCGENFKQRSYLLRHERTHTGEKPYKCSVCGKSFSQRSHIITHERTHTGERPYRCSDCGKSFNRKANLMAHERTHTGEKPYECSDCGKCFSQSSWLMAHKIIHTGEKPYKCKHCGKCFNHRSSLIKHQRSHSEEKPYGCSDCGKSFNESSKLIKHQRIHTGEKPYKCPQCGKSFCFRSSLSQHERTHTGEKPYECRDCGRSFRQKSHLIRHERMHTGEKPYNCLDCRKTFSRSSALVEHKRIHTGERPYTCLHCGKSFNQRSYSIIHERSHTEEKPYKCLDCGKGFSLSSHLGIHEQMHASETL